MKIVTEPITAEQKRRFFRQNPAKTVYLPIKKETINDFIYLFVLIAQKQCSLSRAARRHVVLQVKEAIKWGWIKVDGGDIWNALASKEKPEPMNVEQKTDILEQKL